RRALGGGVDLGLDLVPDLDLVVRADDPGRDDPPTEELDGIARLPRVELPVGAVPGRIAAAVTAVSVRLHLQEAGAVAMARSFGGFGRGRVDRVDLLAVDDDSGYPVWIGSP